jgi:hypothetical protein
MNNTIQRENPTFGISETSSYHVDKVMPVVFENQPRDFDKKTYVKI